MKSRLPTGGRRMSSRLPTRVCILCGLKKAIDRFPRFAKGKPERDKACAVCVARIDAPITEEEKAECRARSAARHSKAKQRAAVVNHYLRRNAPLPLWLAEEHDLEPDCTWDPNRPTLPACAYRPEEAAPWD